MILRALFAISLLLLPYAAQSDFGPYRAVYVASYDADSQTYRVHFWPGMMWEGNVRLDELDTPERSWRAKCESERIAADRARDYVDGLLSDARDIFVTVRKLDKFGRPLVSVTADGINLNQSLVALGHAREYLGGRRLGWCSPQVLSE